MMEKLFIISVIVWLLSLILLILGVFKIIGLALFFIGSAGILLCMSDIMGENL
jgi:hypothetical protein